MAQPEPEAHDEQPRYTARQEAALDTIARILAAALQRDFDEQQRLASENTRRVKSD